MQGQQGASEPALAVAIDAAAEALTCISSSSDASTLDRVNAHSDVFVEQLAVRSTTNAMSDLCAARTATCTNPLLICVRQRLLPPRARAFCVF